MTNAEKDTNHRNSNTTPKKKKKAKRIRKRLGIAADSVQTITKRDFSAALTEYLVLWKDRDNGSGWKFNKVLQSWAVTHILSKKHVDKDLFKLACPYMAKMVGVQRERFLESVEKVIEAGDISVKEEEIREEPRSDYNRALKLRIIMNESN